MAQKTSLSIQNVLAALLLITATMPLWEFSECLADTAEQQFYSAEVFCNKFLEDSEKTKYRDNWLVCIHKFQKAYKTNPSSTLASASLYMVGKLYQDLYFHSFLTSDKEEAIDTYKRLVKRFPGSYYRRKSEEGLAKLSPSGEAIETKTPTKSPLVRKKSNPTRPSETKTASEAPVKTSGKKSVAKTEDSPPLKTRKKIVKEFKARYRASAADTQSDEIARLILKRQKALASRVSSPPPHRPPPADAAVIQGLRVWSNPSYTRIVVDANKDTKFKSSLLDQDKALNKPQRLYIDFENSRLGRNLEKVIPIDDDLLTAARAGQWQSDVVRVVIDIKSFQSYKIFALQNPFRIILDIWGAETLYARAPKPVPKPIPWQPTRKREYEPDIVTNDPKLTPSDLAKQLALGVRRIVIDPGHGGHDGGAPGCMKGVKEKDIVLQIALRLARKIRKELGCEVIMTRSDDRFLSLEERTAIANTKNADLFISIHANAHKDQRAYGLETYFLNLATDDDAILVAARENATSRKNISDLHDILTDLMKNSKINESSRLAGYVQKNMTAHLRGKYPKIKDKGVKKAPFYVLLGARMPSILVETAFISNPRECKRLMDGNYQEHLSNAILRGVRQYIKDTSPTAFLRHDPRARG